MTRESESAPVGPLAILAPTGRDAVIIEQTLGRVGIATVVATGLSGLCALLRAGSGVGVAGLLIAEEGLTGGIGPLVETLAAQAPWSDLPIIVLTARGAKDALRGRLAFLEALGNVSLLDRPLHRETLQSAARALLRARARQFQTRDYLDALEQDAVTLEARVADRTHALMAAEETLRQSQKMEAIGQLTGGIAHDFNNLLASILGSFGLLQLRLKNGNATGLERYIEAGRASAERAAALTHRLLAFARRQRLDPKPTNANALIRSMLELIQRTLGPQIAVTTALSPDSTWTLCDPPQLESALLNLCINARDAMPTGGALTIATFSTTLVENPEMHPDARAGTYVGIRVTDTGIGMSPEVLARAFEPFFTTKPVGSGTGLGLAMIYGFMQQSGGHVRMESEETMGTTVEVCLPHYAGDLPEEEAIVGESQQAAPCAGKTVLVVDDEENVRMVVADVLRDMQCAVLEAANAGAGLDMLRSDRSIDFVISDIGMPGGMNGLQMVDAGRQSRPDLKVLFITGYAAPSVFEAHRDGDAVLRKPFSIGDLKKRVEMLVTND
ncbi:response regulator [Robbsia sp. Bb-Pol-6]|uniref:histidine kinase n=1 Tax=Robbsia betulipollinis TaxID=2981849 RepID=A0ABT3ZK50_9BURK|nr:ATP-binding protein [Robbsia betulipollinis]MCY0386905.1 response regulator [Robbsia betulipollinis]